jgi:prepilin-type processing-associated H-X9-DG protein
MRGGFAIREAVVALVVAVVIMAILVPSLQHARIDSRRAVCKAQLGVIGQAWLAYLADHDNEFPTVPGNNPFMWGGVQITNDDSIGPLDAGRPINAYLPHLLIDEHGHHICKCPSDCGVTDVAAQVGTGSRTAFSSFGTSYRANGQLLNAGRLPGRTSDEFRGVHRTEITTPPSRMLVVGDPVWFEVFEQTGRDANWHRDPAMGNFLFLDGSVRYVHVLPRDQVGPVVVDPVMVGTQPRAHRRSHVD